MWRSASTVFGWGFCISVVHGGFVPSVGCRIEWVSFVEAELMLEGRIKQSVLYGLIELIGTR